METFYITFGQKYRHEPHALGGHPDGYFSVMAEDVMNALEIVYAQLGHNWANLYAEDTLERPLFPLGELACVRPIAGRELDNGIKLASLLKL